MQKNNMSKEQKITREIKPKDQSLKILQDNFSQFFDKRGRFDFDKFKNELSTSEVNFSNESYGIDWLGKSYARILASDSATTLLREDEVHNQKIENKSSENLLVKGDNLEVLKHLTNAYYEKVKMIYIDPPYNTGNDGFVYKDDRKFDIGELKALAGIDEEKAKRIIEFTQSKSNSHSAWLTFMYPRLYVARQLLREDGVIFISIDDNELAQLRILMDEVFGEENFVGNIIVQTATDNNKTQINIEHEYILCYCRQKNSQDYWSSKNEPADLIQKKYVELRELHHNDTAEIQKNLRKWIKENKEDLPRVAHYDNVDERGVFHDADIANTKLGGYHYTVIHPTTGKPCKVPEKGFRFPEDTLKSMILKDDIVFGDDETTLIKPKTRLENAKDALRSIIYEDGRASSNYLDGLLKRGVFNNPKSPSVLKRIFGFITSGDDIILDFFAGSGSTGHAVMQLNAEDGDSRRFILVQIPELIDKKSKSAYEFVKDDLKIEIPTIFEITKERLIRTSGEIQNEIDVRISETARELKKLQKQLQLADTPFKIQSLKERIERLERQDLGFKIFETMPIWKDYNFDADKLKSQKKLFNDDKLSEDDLKALLTTWKTYDGIALTQELQCIDLNGYKSYYSNNKVYLINRGFKTENLKTLLEKIDGDKDFNPMSIIAFGYSFESKNLREIAENIKSYTNKKNIDIDFITRY
jgi:adenine-specific DNA-methyltransferase